MVQTPSPNDNFFGLDISSAKKTFTSLRRKVSKRYLLLEFGNDTLTYGEARVINDQVHCSKINRINIDETALERGTPTDVKAMSSFLTQIIDEDQIWATRVAITLPPEASLSRIIHLPDQLNYYEAIDCIKNPSKSGFQFPISLEQNDFDLIPLNCLATNDKTKAYFLNIVPKKLIDNIVNTIDEANLELQSVDIAYTSLERLASSSINKLETNKVIILLELCLECTHFYVISNSGPIHASTLAAIRAFEVPRNYEGDIAIEEITIESEEYLEITELDLKVLLTEIRNEIEKLKIRHKVEISEFLLSGINSSHPNISKLFQKKLNITTNVLRSLSCDYIRDINLTRPLCYQELNRLIGLSLCMLETENTISKDNSRKTKITNKKEAINKKNKAYDSTNYSILSDENEVIDENNSINESELLGSEDNTEEISTSKIKPKNKDSFEDFLKENNNEKIVNNSIDNDVKTEPLLDFGSNLNNEQDNSEQKLIKKTKELEINNNKDKESYKNNNKSYNEKSKDSLLDFDSNLDNSIKDKKNKNEIIMRNDKNDLKQDSNIDDSSDFEMPDL